MPALAVPEQVAAREAGKKTYIGSRCQYGHNIRYTSCGACVRCGAEGNKRRKSKAAALIKDPQNFTHPVFVLGNPTRTGARS